MFNIKLHSGNQKECLCGYVGKDFIDVTKESDLRSSYPINDDDKIFRCPHCGKEGVMNTDKAYNYNWYHSGWLPHSFLGVISADSPKDAIIKAGLEWVEKEGGLVKKSRQGLGYTNSKIFIYFKSTVCAEKQPQRPDYTFERII
jgi:hypothetical protein